MRFFSKHRSQLLQNTPGCSEPKPLPPSSVHTLASGPEPKTGPVEDRSLFNDELLDNTSKAHIPGLLGRVPNVGQIIMGTVPHFHPRSIPATVRCDGVCSLSVLHVRSIGQSLPI